MSTKDVVDLARGNWKPIPIEVIRSDLTDREFRVWCHLFAYDRDNGKANSRSVSTLTKDLGRKDRETFQEIINSLEAKGFLFVIKRKGTTSIYAPLNPYLKTIARGYSPPRGKTRHNIYKKGKTKFGARVVSIEDVNTLIREFSNRHRAATNTIYLLTPQDRAAAQDALCVCDLDTAITYLDTVFNSTPGTPTLTDICSHIERQMTRTLVR